MPLIGPRVGPVERIAPDLRVNDADGAAGVPVLGIRVVLEVFAGRRVHIPPLGCFRSLWANSIPVSRTSINAAQMLYLG